MDILCLTWDMYLKINKSSLSEKFSLFKNVLNLALLIIKFPLTKPMFFIHISFKIFFAIFSFAILAKDKITSLFDHTIVAIIVSMSTFHMKYFFLCSKSLKFIWDLDFKEISPGNCFSNFGNSSFQFFLLARSTLKSRILWYNHRFFWTKLDKMG